MLDLRAFFLRDLCVLCRSLREDAVFERVFPLKTVEPIFLCALCVLGG